MNTEGRCLAAQDAENESPMWPSPEQLTHATVWKAQNTAGGEACHSCPSLDMTPPLPLTVVTYPHKTSQGRERASKDPSYSSTLFITKYMNKKSQFDSRKTKLKNKCGTVIAQGPRYVRTA